MKFSTQNEALYTAAALASPTSTAVNRYFKYQESEYISVKAPVLFCHQVPKSLPPARSEHEKTVEQLEKLYLRWKRETGALSLTSQKVSHPSYLQMVGFGAKALPFLFKTIQKSPSQLILAIQAITKENPVKPGSSISEAIDSWLNWARENGYVA